jgi:hypothetical protein
MGDRNQSGVYPRDALALMRYATSWAADGSPLRCILKPHGFLLIDLTNMCLRFGIATAPAGKTSVYLNASEDVAITNLDSRKPLFGVYAPIICLKRRILVGFVL